jgi:acyl-CoA reductase-like NAD-dependent aldehyde dehydrogenase
MSTRLGHRIAGRTIAGAGVIESRNPSDLSDLVAMTPDGDAAILDEAIAAAAAAQPGWAALSPEARGDVLDRAGALLMERADALGELLAREEGKTRAEGRGEVVRAARIFRYFGGEALRLHGRTLASVRPGLDVTTHQEPLGVIGLITPWNFPIAVPAWKAAPALAFGNSVVLKPAGITPAIVSAMVDALEEAGLPAGVINLTFVPGRIAALLLDASVVRVRDLDEAITIANESEFGLSAGIATTSLASASRFRKQIQAGMVMVNTPTAGVDYHVPFGGTKASSMGPREQGFAAHEFYTRTKTVYTNP